MISRLDPAARGKVYQTDLKAQGVTEYGDLGLDAAWELQVWLARVDNQGEDAMGSTYASVGKKVRPRLEVFFNDQPTIRAPTSVAIATPIAREEASVCAHRQRSDLIVQRDHENDALVAMRLGRFCTRDQPCRSLLPV